MVLFVRKNDGQLAPAAIRKKSQLQTGYKGARKTWNKRARASMLQRGRGKHGLKGLGKTCYKWTRANIVTRGKGKNGTLRVKGKYDGKFRRQRKGGDTEQLSGYKGPRADSRHLSLASNSALTF